MVCRGELGEQVKLEGEECPSELRQTVLIQSNQQGVGQENLMAG